MEKIVVFFDLECTSISFNPDNVRIVEIAAIKVDLNTLKEVDRLYFKCNNGDVHIANDAYEVHGISEESVRNLPTFNDKAKEVFLWHLEKSRLLNTHAGDLLVNEMSLKHIETTSVIIDGETLWKNTYIVHRNVIFHK